MLALVSLLPVALVCAPQDSKRDPQPPDSTASAVKKTVGDSVDLHTYIIGPEDILLIQVWREPDFSGLHVVRPDGKITLPLIGEMQAGGLTPEKLGKGLVESLAKYLNNPDVDVSVQSVQSKKYFMDGEVNRPGEYKLVTPTTVLEALSHAGGFRDFANSKGIRILRGNSTMKFNYKEVSKGRKMDQNVLLENGDHVIVP